MLSSNIFCVISFLLKKKTNKFNVMLLIDVKVCTVLACKNCFLLIKQKYILNVYILNARGNISGKREAGICTIDVIRGYREPVFKYINSIIPVFPY